MLLYSPQHDLIVYKMSLFGLSDCSVRDPTKTLAATTLVSFSLTKYVRFSLTK